MKRGLGDLKILECTLWGRGVMFGAMALIFAPWTFSQQVTTTIKLPSVGDLNKPILDAARNRIYLPVINGLAIVDGVTNQVTTVTTPDTYQSGTAFNALTDKLYLSGPDLLVVDLKTNALTHVPITNPRALTLDPSLNVIYAITAASGEAPGTFFIIDGVTNLVKQFPIATDSPDMVVNPVTHKVYIPHCDGDGFGTDSHYSVFQAGAETPLTFPILGHACSFRAAVNVATNRIYFLNEDHTNTIQVLDGDLDTVIAQVDLPASIPRAIVANPITNKIYVLCDLGNLVVLDANSNTTTTVHVQTTDDSNQSMNINLSTNQIYLTNISTGVSVVDGDTLDVKFFPLTFQTREIVVNPITNKAYAVNAGNLVVMDGAFNKPARIPTGLSPAAAAVNLVTGKAYVANADGGTLSEIDEATDATVNIPVGTNPVAVAVNSVTNQIYVANKGSNTVSVLDGLTHALATVGTGTAPVSAGVNPATNQIYVANNGSDSVSVIDGFTNTTATITVGSRPIALAVNPANNKIYVASEGVADVTVIDGVDNSVQRVSVDALSTAIAVNPNTNLVYVADDNDAVRVIDGATNQKTIVQVGRAPVAIAVNPVTNKIYVANNVESTVSVIDGPTNVVATVQCGLRPTAISVNPTSNKIYVTDGEDNATVIEGDTNTTSKVAVGTVPVAVAVDPTLNKIYVLNSGSADVTVISERQNKPIPLTTAISPTSFTGQSSPVSNPSFSFALSSAFAPNATTPLDAFFQVDTWRGPWTPASLSAGTFSGQTPSLPIGDHILYAYAGDGQDSSMVARHQTNVGAIAAYPFTVTGVTAVQPQIILSANNATATVTRGGSATYVLSVSAQGNLTTPVTFSCGPLPANTTCTFAPPSVNATSTPTTVTLTVSTTAPAMVMNFPRDILPLGIVGSLLLFAAVVFHGLNRKRGDFTIYARRPIFPMCAAAMLFFVAGCSSIPRSTQPPVLTGGTPTGSFTITITSAAGSVQSTTNLTLVVQ